MHSRLILFWIPHCIAFQCLLYIWTGDITLTDNVIYVLIPFFVISCVLWIPCALRNIIEYAFHEFWLRYNYWRWLQDLSFVLECWYFFASSTYTCHYLFMEIIIDAIDTTSFKVVLSIASIFSLHPETPFFPYFSMHQSLVFKIIHWEDIVFVSIYWRGEIVFLSCVNFVQVLWLYQMKWFRLLQYSNRVLLLLLLLIALFVFRYSFRMPVYQPQLGLQYYHLYIIQLFIPLWVPFYESRYTFSSNGPATESTHCSTC